ncbi:MAG TPA: ABC transporter ATP-binding protein [Verrucomicrobiae bacterium]|nr:ABC transporter ATP-binding protein [Verrucomicrobiae bacterium]
MIDFFRKLWDLIRPYRSRFALGVVTGIISGLIEPLMIATITFVYGVIFPSANASFPGMHATWLPAWIRQTVTAAQEALTGAASHPGAVILLVSSIPVVMLLRGFFSYLNIYCLQWAAVRAVTRLRTRLFEHLMNLSAGFFHRANTGELMSRIMNDTAMLQNLLCSNTATMIKDPVTLLSLFTYLMWTQPKLTLLSVLVLPVCIVPIAIYNKKSRQSGRAMQSQLAELGSVMAESFTGFRVIKAYNLETTAVGQFQAAASRFISHYMRIVRAMEIPGPLLEFVGALGVAAVLVYLALSGGVRTTSADFLAVLLAIYSMYRPIKSLTRLYNNLEQARASSERAFQLLDTPFSVPEPAQPKPLHAAGAAIEFAAVSFAYGDKPALRDVNLTIAPGQVMALVGPSGSGKTSLTNLLLRFYDPQHGRIRIGGVDLRDVSSRELRNQMAVVTQETILFNDTIRNNIALGRPGATDEEIVAAAKHAYAHEFILQKEGGYEALVGEKGVNLSGGQRQRIAIARAILRDAPILILDEATSALDTESEHAVQQALEQLMQGRTTIVIAHRLSTIQKADVIVVFEQGRIVERGTHVDLLQSGGLYQRLHDMTLPA